MSKWFFINVIVLCVAIWKISTGSLRIHIIFGGLGLIFILYNWTRHAVFSTIRSNITRKRKVIFASISRKLLPLHKWTGTSALIFIIIHATLIITHYGFQIENRKWLSGVFSGIILFVVVTTGWLRFVNTTIYRRYIHWGFGFVLFFFVLLHIIL